MAARLVESGYTGESTEQFAIYTLGGETAFDGEAGIYATICGRLRWEESELARAARDRGNAHALLAAHRKHGADCLQRLRGDFAVAIVDSMQRSALLAIDRMGIQPLCYALTASGELVFGSTADLVRIHPDVGLQVDPQALFSYVYFHMIPSPDTIYRDVYKLEPAQCVTYREGKFQSSRYWQPRFCETTAGVDVASLQAELQDTLRASVARCTPDHQTGAFLSGGLDSSTVCGLLAKARDQQTHVYTIGFEATGYDEMEYARIAARHFRLDLHEYYVAPSDIVDAIPQVARAHDEPFANSSAIPSLFCARLAREHGTRTLLAGDGGDELFAGNTRYVKQQIFDAYGLIPAPMRRAILEPLLLRSELTRHLPVLSKVRSYIEQSRLPMPERTQSYNYLCRTSLESVFDPDFLSGIDTQHPVAVLSRVYAEAPAQTLLNRMLYLDWKFTLADNDLRKVGRACEAAGLRVCYPMLDETVVDFSLRVPPQIKIRRFKLRDFYKRALDGFLPPEIIRKSKHGFGLPFGEWLKTSAQLQDLIYSSLHALKTRGVIRGAFIDTLIEMHRRDHAAYYGTMIWVLAMLEQWFQQRNLRP
jgi:asparagine synthase (glutamine-hydrolysing)